VLIEWHSQLRPRSVPTRYPGHQSSEQ
jgi:hypothetical protein